MSTATLIASIDAKIAQLLDDTGNLGDYRIGQKRVDSGTFLAHLTKMRGELILQGQEEPYEDIRQIALEVDEFGVDVSEYIGSETA